MKKASIPARTSATTITEPLSITPLDPHRDEDLERVVEGMQATLLEVVGQPLYEANWLRQRVLWHLDPEQVQGAVFLAKGADYLGHTIVRKETQDIGLFSTTYVQPQARRRGVARQLIARGELWMAELGLSQACTYTAAHNRPLQQLYQSLGYRLEPAENEFVKLSRPLQGGKSSQSAGRARDTT